MSQTLPTANATALADRAIVPATRAAWSAGRPSPSPTAPTLTYADGVLLREGRPHQVIAGGMHYFRVHPALWRDRMARLADLGVNALDTYVAWNFHERVEGEPRFDGWRDIERYLLLAQDAGLDVVVRPGPYICAEWDNGGLPAWLSARPGIRLRSTDPQYLDAVERWFDVLVPRLVPLQASAGGPVVAVQVENEFGSFGADQEYLRWVHDALRDRGITELMFTADGPTQRMQEGGSIPGVLAAATFGSKPEEAAALLRARRDGEPFLCAEFWNGWFDHWGERHHVRSAADAAHNVQSIVSTGGSISIYMAHGGTNFGLWAGANYKQGANDKEGANDKQGENREGSLQPTVTSYDSDAPIAENGALTPKYFAIRSALWPDACTDSTSFEPAPATLRPRTIPVVRGAGLLAALRSSAAEAQASSRPPSFEQLGLGAGMVLYRAHPTLPAGERVLRVTGLHDRAVVFLDGKRVGVVDTETGELALSARGGVARLELLVENQGRINYGPLLGQGKGILGGVEVDGADVRGWHTTPLPLDEWSGDELRRRVNGRADGDPTPAADSAGFATAHLDLDAPEDTFLALPGFGKGFVWIGDFLLGRYWNIGPQQTLYVPGPLLHAGENTITVLELEHRGDSLELRDHAELGQSEEYVETF